MRERDIIFAARVISAIFHPFYLATVGLIFLFIFSYMGVLPLKYKLSVLGFVYLCTVLLPAWLIKIYRKYQGWSLIELGSRERRAIPYVIAIVCYFLCYYILNLLHVPHFMTSIIVVALAIQVVCAIVNLFWKISTHTAAIGGVAGALIAFSGMFSYNPVWWLCLIIIVAGILGTSRMILRQHSLSQVVAGFLLGFVLSFLVILRF
ncbi:MAG: phosphatase PAP2 family protein [Prevotella sp.]|nr:phosphatase PAP2 family protein [Prevotella sp.]MBR5929920.1 phosphatase PAP2 family protein [Prevotella sp.]